jgi:monoamine oxidase
MASHKQSISRRRFLGLLAASAGAAALQSTVLKHAPLRAQAGESVLIVGAGAAGIGAGRMLHDAGYRVTILEARDRIGGRVWTDRSLMGLPLDMGASWIHGVRGNPLTDLVQQYGIRTLPSDADNINVYAADGEVVNDRTLSEMESAFEELLDELDSYRETLDEDMTVGAAIRYVLEDWDVSDEERHVIMALVNTNIEHEYAADVDDLSLWWWDDDSELAGGDVLFPDGYGQIFERLADGLDIRLGHGVQSVTYDGDDGVSITTSQGVFEADYAIVTVPLGVLKAGAIRFDPPLPQAKQAAIRDLGMSVLNKVYLHFPDVFWDRDAEWMLYLGERTGEWADAVNIYAYTGQPVLLLFNAAEFGLAIEDMPDAEIVRRAMEMLRSVYGANIPEPDGVLITRWGKDPYALGSYSSISLGATPADREALAESVEDVLFFAGEATSSEFPSTVHGALLSGRAAAEGIMDA